MRGKLFGLALTVALVMPILPASAGPDLGGRIVYVDAFGGSGIYAIAPDGTNRVRLVAGGDVSYPRWAPDGSGLAFTVSGRLWAYRIEKVDDNGENRTTLISRNELPEGWALGGFTWSPDASMLAVALFETEGSHRRVYVTPADGSDLQLLALNASAPDWSSTDRILVTRGGDIVTMDPDGSDQAAIVERGDNVGRPRWSADGSRIVFERMLKAPGEPRRSDVMVVNADGSGLVNVTNSPRVFDWSPAFSPTGDHIVWSPSPPGDSFGFADLWRMRSNGRGTTEITSTRRIDEYTPDWAAVPV